MKREENRKLNETKFLNFVLSLKDYKIIEDNFVYKNAHQKVKMRHEPCGREWEVSISKFMNDGSRCPNPSCFTEKRVSHLRKEEKFYSFIEGKYEIVDMSFKYTSNKDRIKIKHVECGNIFEPIISNLTRGLTKCPKCKNINRKDSASNKFINIVDNLEDYEIISNNNTFKSEDKVKLLHKKCNTIFEPTVHNFKDSGSRCPKCSNTGPSKQEKEVFDWLNSFYAFDIIENTRSIIKPKELDLYLPKHNFAIEFNGLYWHSEQFLTEKRSHYDKSVLCKEKEIQLFHIFSDEWEFKKPIVKSMIKNRIGLSENRIFARKCEVREVSNKEAKEFFSRTHISGYTNAKKSFALTCENEIVACISLREPFHKKYKGSIEIARFSTKLNTSVIGGFSRVLKRVIEWSKQEGYSEILSYADLRFGDGKVYEKSGFKLVGKTDVDYWYTDGVERYNRFKYRAHGGKTEKEVALENSMFKVYGCGSNIYLLTL